MRERSPYSTSLPKWRRPLVGYIYALPILLLSLLVAVFLQRLFQRFLFPATFLLLAVCLSGLTWGVGPALFMLIIGVIVFYYFTPLIIQFPVIHGDIVQVLPIFVIGLIILFVIGQRERAYRKIQTVSQELDHYARELETVNSHLEDENREKEGVLSIASHELKAPVTTIQGYSQLLRRRLAKRSILTKIPDLELAFKRIDEQTVRLTILIDRLLGVHTFRSSEITLLKSQYDLNQLCREVLADQRELTGRDVVFSPTQEPLELLMDVDRMTQVVLNLVSNALKYSPEAQPVEVRVSRNDQCALLQVQDHGYGIAPDEVPQIFNRFYRTSRARASTTSGRGLGLAISKEIVDQHGGGIWCESELGVGSTFFVELPLCMETGNEDER